MNDATVILVPVLRRPHRVAPLLESIARATPEPHRVLFITSASDDAELGAIDAHGGEAITVPDPGTYPVKINAGARATDEPLLFLAADDLAFRPGWLSAAQAQLVDGIEVVGTNDLWNQRVLDGRHSTHSLVRRSYVERGAVVDEPGAVLHEGYRHWYVDDELISTARRRGVYAHAHDSIVEHLHPYAGKAPRDDVYALGEAHRRHDRQIFYRRRKLWMKERAR